MSKYFIFITASSVLLLSSIGSTSVAVAFPIITSSFNASLILAAWVINAYQLMVIATMPIAGKIGDVLGRKSAYILFLSLFIVGSLLCAMAPTIELLIFFRLIQGIGGGGFLPFAAGIVSDQFPQSRQQAIGLITSIVPIGQIVGPNLGGWLITSFGWSSIFWLNVPIGLTALIALSIMLRSQPGKQKYIDMLGAGLLASSLFSLLTAVSQIGNTKTTSSWVLVGLLFAVSIILMIVFVRRETKIDDPIIDLRTLREKSFAAANIYNFLFGFCKIGVISLIPLYAVSVYDMSTLLSGLIITPRSISMILFSTITSILLVRWGYRWPMIIGNIIGSISLFFLAVELHDITICGVQLNSLTLIMIFMFLTGIGSGIASPASNNACIELMPERVSTIVGLRGMFRQSGNALGVAITSLVLYAVGDLALGFKIIFFTMGILLLATIPIVFLMPRGCQPLPPKTHSG
jgi:EmrB/QacA subfamily drug resistance transporter